MLKQKTLNVLAAADLEPVKGMMVGLHADLSDSAFVKKPFDRVKGRVLHRCGYLSLPLCHG